MQFGFLQSLLVVMDLNIGSREHVWLATLTVWNFLYTVASAGKSKMPLAFGTADTCLLIWLGFISF